METQYINISAKQEQKLQQLMLVPETKQIIKPSAISVEVYEIPSDTSTPPASPRSPSLAQFEDASKVASKILDILERYGQHLEPKGGESHSEGGGWLGRSLFLGKVEQQLEKGQSIHMILPAFPWKSINRIDKVTGILPDLGEELALDKLNQICEDIKTVYPLGGKVIIANDGLVFDDVLGITDEHTWAYSEGLINMVHEKGLRNIQILRPMEIMGFTEGKTPDKALYMSLVQKCRDELMAHYGRTEPEVRQMMQDDPDTLLTYLGFVRFLDADLRFSPVTMAAKDTSRRQYKKKVKEVAIMMMIRAESFTKVLQAYCPDYVRLSIHQSSGLVKLSIPLITQGSGEFPRSPWHSCIALALDGSYSTVHSQTVRGSHNLIQKDGRGYYYREKSALWDWEDDEVIFQPMYPNRLIIKPATYVTWGRKTLSAIEGEKLKGLREAYTKGSIEVLGFANTA
ncbi:Pyoverdine/dityrosine biosynthesis protein-domain-containing protein [Annulohypoxylon bovei var. microspora]|nr:Pyoverdine/dityrosine biosynthesis protein-domain-containing protein [Annulohypoxylon bovei var. microspora]